MFIDGFAGLCSGVGSGAVIEMNLPRQPISFALTKDRHPLTGAWGLARNTAPVRFGLPVTASPAGLGIFSAPTGGVLLLALPFAAPRPLPGGGLSYAADDGTIVIAIAAMAGNPNPDSEPNLTFAPSAAIGTWWDAPAVGPLAVVPSPGTFVPAGGYLPAFLNEQPATAGVGLVIQRGVMNVQL